MHKRLEKFDLALILPISHAIGVIFPSEPSKSAGERFSAQQSLKTFDQPLKSIMLTYLIDFQSD